MPISPSFSRNTAAIPRVPIETGSGVKIRCADKIKVIGTKVYIKRNSRVLQLRKKGKENKGYMNPYIGHESQLYGIEEHRLVGGKGDGMRLYETITEKG